MKRTDVAKQTEIVHEMCMIGCTRVRYIIPIFASTIDYSSPRLVSSLPTQTGTSLSSYGFKKFWFDT